MQSYWSRTEQQVAGKVSGLDLCDYCLWPFVKVIVISNVKRQNRHQLDRECETPSMLSETVKCDA